MGLHFPLLSFTLLDSLHFTGTLWAVLRVLPCLVIHYWWRPVPGPPPLSGPNGGRLLAPTGPLAGFIYITSPLRCGTVGSAKWTKLTLPYLATTGSYHRFQWRTKAPVGRKRGRKGERAAVRNKWPSITHRGWQCTQRQVLIWAANLC